MNEQPVLCGIYIPKPASCDVVGGCEGCPHCPPQALRGCLVAGLLLFTLLATVFCVSAIAGWIGG
jgi:hypothetical protein